MTVDRRSLPEDRPNNPAVAIAGDARPSCPPGSRDALSVVPRVSPVIRCRRSGRTLLWDDACQASSPGRATKQWNPRKGFSSRRRSWHGLTPEQLMPPPALTPEAVVEACHRWLRQRAKQEIRARLSSIESEALLPPTWQIPGCCALYTRQTKSAPEMAGSKGPLL